MGLLGCQSDQLTGVGFSSDSHYDVLPSLDGVGNSSRDFDKVRSQGSIKVPVPYLRWRDRTAIVVAGKRDRDVDANLRLTIDLAGTGLAGQKSYTVTDLWSSQEPRSCTAAQLLDFHCTIKRDGTAGGGLSVLKIEAA